MALNRGPAENQLTTSLAHSASHHYPHPVLGAAVDHVRTPVVDSIDRFHTRLPGRERRDPESMVRTRVRASAKAVDSPPAVRTRPSGHRCDICCSGLQRIRNWGRRFHEGGVRRPTPGEPGFLYHRRIDLPACLAPKDYTEGNRVLDGRNRVGYTQA